MSYRFTIALSVLTAVIHVENGPVTNRDQPRAKRIAPALMAITSGTEHGCGLATDGRAFCWGSNRLGQLGDDGDAPDRSSVAGMVAVATRETFVAISAGANHTCALTRDGAAH